MDPDAPDWPDNPGGPRPPVDPTGPGWPGTPLTPNLPGEPVDPTGPVIPVSPGKPVAPDSPTIPVGPVGPVLPVYQHSKYVDLLGIKRSGKKAGAIMIHSTNFSPSDNFLSSENIFPATPNVTPVIKVQVKREKVFIAKKIKNVSKFLNNETFFY